MLLLILLVAVVLCGLVLYLPYSAGLTHLERETHKKTPESKKKHKKQHQYEGYIPPDEELRLRAAEEKNHGLKARASAMKERLNVTSDDLPFKIKLNQDSVVRKRHEKPVGDIDPNNYDYDLDELIEEETAGAARKQVEEFYLHETVGGDNEEMV